MDKKQYYYSYLNTYFTEICASLLATGAGQLLNKITYKEMGNHIIERVRSVF